MESILIGFLLLIMLVEVGSGNWQVSTLGFILEGLLLIFRSWQLGYENAGQALVAEMVVLGLACIGLGVCWSLFRNTLHKNKDAKKFFVFALVVQLVFSLVQILPFFQVGDGSSVTMLLIVNAGIFAHICIIYTHHNRWFS